MWTPPRQKLLDPLLGMLSAMERGVPPLEHQRLMDAAVARTGLEDFAPDRLFREGFHRLLRSAEREAHLSHYGRFMLGQVVVNALVLRLRLVHLRRTWGLGGSGGVGNGGHPVERDPPVMVVGLPRSGTTLLHRLLALDPRRRALPAWELWEPLPGTGSDHRRRRAAIHITLGRLLAPGIDVRHEVRVDNSEECVMLLNASFVSPGFWQIFPVDDYHRWVFGRDLTESYGQYRDIIRALQARTAPRALVLKSPAHTAHLSTLVRLFPGIRLVQCHRDPERCLASLRSLVGTVHRSFTRGPSTPRGSVEPAPSTGDTASRWLARMMAESLRVRDRGRCDPVDVRYTDLVSDPLGVVRRIHREHQLGWNPDHEDRIRSFLDRRHWSRTVSHRYPQRAEASWSEPASQSLLERYRSRFLL